MDPVLNRSSNNSMSSPYSWEARGFKPQSSIMSSSTRLMELNNLKYVGVTEKVARFLSGSEKIIKSNQNIEK
jgi:hypothetical protein